MPCLTDNKAADMSAMIQELNLQHLENYDSDDSDDMAFVDHRELQQENLTPFQPTHPSCPIPGAYSQAFTTEERRTTRNIAEYRSFTLNRSVLIHGFRVRGTLTLSVSKPQIHLFTVINPTDPFRREQTNDESYEFVITSQGDPDETHDLLLPTPYEVMLPHGVYIKLYNAERMFVNTVAKFETFNVFELNANLQHDTSSITEIIYSLEP